ncbi:hypothetical protein ACHAWF_014387 [Thalassiosira exigua]
MEVGAHVWLRSPSSQWGWVPARIADKEEVPEKSGSAGARTGSFHGGNNKKSNMVRLTLRDDTGRGSRPASPDLHSPSRRLANDTADRRSYSAELDYFAEVPSFETTLLVDPSALANADHPDVKLRNLSASYRPMGGDPEADVLASPSAVIDSHVVGGVHDLIGLTHLHEPAILHALRLRYDAGIIYTSTGPILIAVNPFRRMERLYSGEVMEQYRMQGEGLGGSGGFGGNGGAGITPYKNSNRGRTGVAVDAGKDKLPPHAYKTADDAYRAMRRGIEDRVLMTSGSSSRKPGRNNDAGRTSDQSILVSGESGAGKTVTTKIVLNYFAMLSRQITEENERQASHNSQLRTPSKFGPSSASGRLAGSSRSSLPQADREEACIEQQVLQSNPILESFGNARTLRNDNSSRFGKYVDIRFAPSGRLAGARIETYLLERVRLIRPSEGERNYHVFYQFLEGATSSERRELGLDGTTVEDFKLLNGTGGTYDRRDGVSDLDMHAEMLDAMATIGFAPATVSSLLRLVAAILHCGNVTFASRHHSDGRGTHDACVMDRTHSSTAAARLLGVGYDDLARALTRRAIRAGNEVVHAPLDAHRSEKGCEALMKACYGAAFDYVVGKVNESISDRHGGGGSGERGGGGGGASGASIGVLDIFGFETFDTNGFEQLCINYTNEALQQQFNRYVFKLEQDEYEREGILWKFISFPDNQDGEFVFCFCGACPLSRERDFRFLNLLAGFLLAVLDLIDRKHAGILALLDEQCIVPRSNDAKFTRYLYARCDGHPRFGATSAQRVDHKFSVEHYAGPVEYATDRWLEKNKDQLPAASVELLRGSEFDLLAKIQVRRVFVRSCPASFCEALALAGLWLGLKVALFLSFWFWLRIMFELVLELGLSLRGCFCLGPGLWARALSLVLAPAHV